MAAVDPIVYAQLCKYFPALTPKQVTNVCFYSLGANHQDISTLLETAPVTVKKSLESVQKHFNTDSLPELKTVFWAGFFFRQICAKYSISSHEVLTSLRTDALSALKPFFPELNKNQMLGAILFSVGFPASEIATKGRFSVNQIEQLLAEAMVAMGVASDILLRMLITSRFVLDLC